MTSDRAPFRRICCPCPRCEYDLRAVIDCPDSTVTCQECGTRHRRATLIGARGVYWSQVSEWWFILLHGHYIGPLLFGIIMPSSAPGARLAIAVGTGLAAGAFAAFIVLGVRAFRHCPSRSHRRMTVFSIVLFNGLVELGILVFLGGLSAIVAELRP